MTLQFLLDENVDPDVAAALERAGYDAVHTQEIDELGNGSHDHEIAAYARRTGRYVFTNDDDLFGELGDGLPALSFLPDQRLPSHRVVSIVAAIERQFGRDGIDEQSAVEVVEGWL